VLRAGEDPYPTALILCQRLGVALEDVGRLAIALRSLGDGDAFEALRQASYGDIGATFTDLASNPADLRRVVRLPEDEDVNDLDEVLGEAIVAASNVLATKWTAQWRDCARAWPLLNPLAKALRHGTPVVPREVVVEEPGAGALGNGVKDAFERWVLLVGTQADDEAEALTTQWQAVDISEQTLSRLRQAGQDGVSLARALANAHVRRVESQSKWAMPRSALKAVEPRFRRVLRENTRV
jgi:hypothetical protein